MGDEPKEAFKTGDQSNVKVDPFANAVATLGTAFTKLHINKLIKFIEIYNYLDGSPGDNTKEFVVPENHYFFMGDNRDCSKDSRFLSSVGYVHKDNLVGKAQFIFFSSDKNIGSIFAFWKWHKSIRFNRTFDRIN